MNMKDLLLNWRASVKKDVLNENKIIHEASDEEVEVLRDVLSDLDPEKLRLNKAFDGKLRKVIPLESVGGQVGAMLDTLQKGGYEVNLKDGTVSYEVRREHEGNVYKSKKTLKINKLLNGFLKHKQKMDVEYNKMSALRSKRYRQTSDEETEQLNKDMEKVQSQMDNLEKVGAKAYRGMDRWVHINHVKKYIAAWEENAGFFKNDPDAFAGFSIIVSRHPVDVLRMSDFDEITSCHTLASRSGESGAFIKCAFAEAIDGGAIAYVVPSQEIKDFEHEYGPIEDANDEILVDENRGIGSIDPVSRIRIRVGEFGDKEELGVPDRSVYGQEMANFYDTLKKWLFDSQQDAIKAIPRVEKSDVGGESDRWGQSTYKEEDIGKIKAPDIRRIGGSYEDNPYERNLAGLLDPEMGLRGIPEIGDVVIGRSSLYSSEDELDLPDAAAEAMIEEITEETADFNRRYSYVELYTEINDWGEGPDVDTHASLRIDLDISDEMFTDTGREELKNHGKEYARAIFEELDGYGLDWADPRGENLISYGINLNHNTDDFYLFGDVQPGRALGEYVYDVDTFTDWGSSVENEIDDKVEDIIEPTAYLVLKREGVLVGNKLDEFYQLTENERSEYHDSDWTFDYLPDEERMDVDLDDIPINIQDIKDMEDLYYEDDTIRELLLKRDFRIMLRKNLFEQVPGFIAGESMYPDITRGYPGYNNTGYGLSFSLEVDHPDEVYDSIKKAVLSIDKETAAEVLSQTYAEIAKADKDYKKQQELPFESNKTINERIHRNWANFLGKSIA